jgi:type III pantothenate kinase
VGAKLITSFYLETLNRFFFTSLIFAVMSEQNRVLVIDAGNTSIKVGCFIEDELIEVSRHQLDSLYSLEKLKNSFAPTNSILSSVLSKEDTESIINLLDNPVVLTKNSRLPIVLKYDTIDTLGADRICNACYSATKSTTKHAVTIDIGTCIKFDITTADNEYLGGSISPGVELRYKSLHDYTGKLPLLSNKSVTKLVGKSTESSMHSGVMNGLNAEIQQLMHHYEEQFDDLTFFVTGGDASFFDIHSKNDIFADENLTLNGLYEIYKHNA